MLHYHTLKYILFYNINLIIDTDILFLLYIFGIILI